MLIDQIAGVVEDVQNARLTRICKPVIYSGGKGKRVNDLHSCRSCLCLIQHRQTEKFTITMCGGIQVIDLTQLPASVSLATT